MRRHGPKADPQWVEILPERSYSLLDLREPWEHRELALFLAERDLKIRYKQTLLGISWAVIQPLVSVVLFTIIFGRLAGLPSDGLAYPIFVLTGLSVWLYFSTAVAAAANSLVAHAALVNKVYLPRIVAPTAAVISTLVDFGIAILLVAAAMIVYGVVPTLAILSLPLWILAAVAVALGAGLWLSALNVRFRDVRYASPYLLQLWLYASPVVFPTSLVEGGWRYLFAMNPMVGVIDGFRWSLVGGSAPQAFHLVSLLSALVLGLSGFAYFRRSEQTFADVI